MKQKPVTKKAKITQRQADKAVKKWLRDAIHVADNFEKENPKFSELYYRNNK